MAYQGIRIPAINGALEAGIAAGIDVSLPAAQKLPILRQGGAVHPNARENALVWAVRNANNRDFFIAGVCSLFETSALRTHGGHPDGDWAFTDTALANPSAAETAQINAALTVDSIRQAFTLIVSTKANWWLYNHHTGQQGALTLYAQKAFVALFNRQAAPEDIEKIHQLGHFASTRIILAEAGIPNIVATTNLAGDDTVNFTFTQDAMIRFQGMPAGTHRCAVADAAIARLQRNVAAGVTPGLVDFAAVRPIKINIMGDPAAFHIGASYLTGQNREDYNDSDMDNLLGRLGTFVRVMFPNSTLAGSPHLTEAKTQGYEDYSPAYQQLLAQLRGHRMDLANVQMPNVNVNNPAAIAALQALYA